MRLVVGSGAEKTALAEGAAMLCLLLHSFALIGMTTADSLSVLRENRGISAGPKGLWLVEDIAWEALDGIAEGSTFGMGGVDKVCAHSGFQLSAFVLVLDLW